MIAGTGIDRVVIARIEHTLQRFGDRFLQRVFSDKEITQAKSRGILHRRLAMLFAGKEAVSKALGTGFHQGVTLRSIEIIHQASGKPEVSLGRGAAKAAQRENISRVHISLTDDGGVAVAMAIAERC